MAEHGNAVWRVCLMRMGSRADAQDAFQETFLKYATHAEVVFQTSEHERAWLLRVASNHCVDMLRSRSHATESFDELGEQPASLELAQDPQASLWEVGGGFGPLARRPAPGPVPHGLRGIPSQRGGKNDGRAYLAQKACLWW